jgi:hypothetical protein
MMPAMRRLFHLIGGIRFALFLIASATLFVIAGTLLESATQSHLYAAQFTYKSPLFTLLLCGFFLNILISALRRWPFKPRHVPFLITHLGLLMILTGTFIKNGWGTQGSLAILEGSIAHQIYLANTEALRLENRRHETLLLPLQEKMQVGELSFQLLERFPHSSSQLESLIDGEPMEITKLPAESWAFYQVEGGFGGYLVRSSLDRDTLREALRDPMLLAPPLQLLSAAANRSGLDFADSTILLLEEWEQTQSWLYPAARPLPDKLQRLLANLDWAGLPPSTQRACSLSCMLLSGVEQELRAGKGVKEILTEKRWPLAHLIEEGNPQDQLTAIHQQIDTIGDQLAFVPLQSPKRAEEKAHLLTAYLRSYGIHLTPAQAPITQKVTPLSPGKKLEENLPAITLAINGAEPITLSYDRYGYGLRWPILSGDYLIRYQPLFKSIPYAVRLRDARQINYPNSDQAYSYEADLVITDLRDNRSVEKTISMNNVHETWDGYRFYLANISPGEETAAQRAQIIVNHDPAKYLLTYPGALCVSMGILLLYTRMRLRRDPHDP